MDVLNGVTDAVAGEGIEDSEKFPGTGDEGELFGYATGEEVFVLGAENGVSADRADGADVRT